MLIILLALVASESDSPYARDRVLRPCSANFGFGERQRSRKE